MKPYYKYSFDQYSIFQTPNLWSTYQNYNYMIVQGDQASVFDPGEFAPINRTLEENNLQVKDIYLTHHHHDHVGATLEFKKKWNCPVFGFSKDRARLPGVTDHYSENDVLRIANLEAQVLFLPGHTLGLCAFYFEEKGWLFSNDLLFSLGCGRIFEGTPPQMFSSLAKVRALPEDTHIFSSHEYTASNLNFALSIFENDSNLLSLQEDIADKLANQQPTVPTRLSYEKRNNPFLRWDDPGLRKSLGMEKNEDWEVFAEIRRLKDMS
ncbi:MAG: hydroxyacylglutathione hydrolase [Pseudomonadota bacterium]